jgi:HEAT repeat protein
MKFEEMLQSIGRADGPLNGRHLCALSEMTQEQMTMFQDEWLAMDRERRRVVVRKLVELTEVSFEVNFDPIFLLAMGDEDSEVRAAAIGGLWEYTGQSLIAPLVYLLHADEAAIVRAAAATALGQYVLLGELEAMDRASSKMAEEALCKTIGQEDETLEVRRRAVESIAYSGESDVHHIIRAAYHSDDETMQASSLFAMGRSADPGWGQVLSMELDNPNPELRFEAARACGELELTRVVPQLGHLVFNDSDREVQQAAVWALGRIGGKNARDILETCHGSEDEVLATSAADALDQLGLFDESSSISLLEEPDEDEDIEFDEMEW